MKATIIKIAKETEKAINATINDGRGEMTTWLPKSQIKISGNEVEIPDWLMEEKRFGEFKQIVSDAKNLSTGKFYKKYK